MPSIWCGLIKAPPLVFFENPKTGKATDRGVPKLILIRIMLYRQMLAGKFVGSGYNCLNTTKTNSLFSKAKNDFSRVPSSSTNRFPPDESP
jgi:hypothetical protein